MKKSRKKIINRLKPLIGKPIIRIKPAYNDFSCTTDPVILRDFTPNGALIVEDISGISAGKICTLPDHFTDWNWISYKRARNSGHSVLNQWKGKRIRRTAPVPLMIGILDMTFMDDDVTLIHASKHHVFLRYSDGGEALVDFRYANPAEWELAA